MSGNKRTYLSGVRRRKLRPKVYDKCFGSCAICGKIIEHIDEMTLDHIIPQSMGGTYRLENMQAAHKECNSKKGNFMDDKELLEHAFKAGRASVNTSFEEWYENFISSAGERLNNKLLKQATALVVKMQQCSVQFLQRHLKITYLQAQALMPQLEKSGVVAKEEGSKDRKILING